MSERTEDLLKERERILTYQQEGMARKHAMYTCVACGKKDLDWETAYKYSYIYNNRGRIDRIGHVYTDIKMCSEECRKIAIPKYYNSYEDFMEDVEIPKIFNGARLSRLETKDETLKSFYEEYTANARNVMSGLYIQGDIGCGKTYVSCSIAYELRKLDFTVLFVKYQDLVLRANNLSYKNSEYDDFIKKYSSYDTIIFDDADNTSHISPNAKSVLFMLFSQLYDEEKRVIVTSNFSIEEVFNNIDKRITSRMKQALVLINITDDDKRAQ